MAGLIMFVVMVGGAVALIAAGHGTAVNAVLGAMLVGVAVLGAVRIVRGRRSGLPVVRSAAILAGWVAFTGGAIAAFAGELLLLGIVLSGLAGFLLRLFTVVTAPVEEPASVEE